MTSARLIVLQLASTALQVAKGRRIIILYLNILFLMAVNILHQLSILESMDSGNNQQDGWKNWKVHLLIESETELLILQMALSEYV